MSDIYYAVTSSCETGYAGTDQAIPKGQTVMIPAWAAVSLQQALRAAKRPAPRVSATGHYTRPYCGQSLDGKKLLATRGAGVGDQLIFAGCLRWLSIRYPGAEIALLCDPRMGSALWDGAEGLPFKIIYEPLPLVEWNKFDYHWIGARLCDGDFEPDQPDVWQGHLQAIGHGDAPREWRRPFVPHSTAWDQSAADFMRELSGENFLEKVLPRTPTQKLLHVADGAAADGENTPAATAPCDLGPCSNVPVALAGGAGGERTAPPAFILWQLAASTPMRSLTPEQTVQALRLLHRERPDVKVILTGSEDQYKRYAGALACPNAASTTAELPIQAVFALLPWCSALVCPDSCLGHIAAEYSTPTISYWCPFPSRVRLSSYDNHHIIEKTCGCSPCFAHETGPQPRGCPRHPATGKNAGGWCKGLLTVTPQEIVEQVKEVLP